MKKWLMSAALFAAVAVLVGCSAGGKDQQTVSGGTTTTPPTATAPIVTLALSSNSITAAAPATVTATVTDSTGGDLAGVVVTFAVNATTGALSSTSALTDAHGVASVTLAPAAATTSGADTITASATVNALTGTASAGYQVNSTTAAFASFVPNTGEQASDALAAYGQAVLTLTTTGASSTAPVSLALTSACMTVGKATISPTTFSATSNTTTFSYKDTGGCGSTLAADTITATITGTATSISTQINLTSPKANSITFTTATPATIYLKGSGNVESSTVQFKVVDTANNPLPGQVVTMNLSTFAGGLLIDQGTSPVTQTSDSNGLVSVIVNSGTVPTPVQVSATLSSGARAVSTNLAVLTGLPTETGFQLIPQAFNIEGFNHVIPNTYTVAATDRSQNPVPDGTSILFWAEKGLMPGTSTTVTGIATSTLSTTDHPADGRVTVLAYAIGEESFQDLNGTNVYQSGDPYQDLGNVIKSTEFDGLYNSATDEVISLSDLGVASGGSSCVTAFSLATYPSFALNATVPNQPSTCDGAWSAKTYVRRATETVLSTDAARPLADPANLTNSCQSESIQNAPATLAGPVTVYPLASNSTLYVGSAASGTFLVRAADANTVRINPMAFGSIISSAAQDTTVITATTVNGSTYTYPGTTEAQWVPVSYTFASGATTGVVALTFTSKPSNLATTVFVTLMRNVPPTTCP